MVCLCENLFDLLKGFDVGSSIVWARLSCTGALTFVDLWPPKRRLPGAANDEADVGFAFVVFTSCSICFSSCTGFGVTIGNYSWNGMKEK